MKQLSKESAQETALSEGCDDLILRVIGHKFHYEAENLCRIFFPNDKITVVRDFEGQDSRTVVTEIRDTDGVCKVNVSVDIDGKHLQQSADCVCTCAGDYDECELLMAQMMFHQLSTVTGYIPPWGVLTGVRPSKLMIKLVSLYGEEGAKRHFTEKLLVSEEKTQLAFSVSQAEEKIVSLSVPESVSLYVSIPFCPSRCSYCSFVSHSISSPAAKKLLAPYIDRLCDEIELTGEIASKLNLRIESIYFGGGTPGVLESDQLRRLCTKINDNFDLSHLREYTVEAGRPDTLDEYKLATLRSVGVDRISINPQTFNQSVLDTVGRKHTVQKTLEVYEAARKIGFNSINMDLIAGLPTESFESFANSVDTAVSLDPENITVHTLALKRSSTLAADGYFVSDGNTAKQMLSYAQDKLMKGDYFPYYMYRQSKCLGNLENVGWCKTDKECVYNIFMMEECHSVFAVGAGAVTKLKAPSSDYIERIFNFKYPYEYIDRYGELTERKKRINEFYLSY